MRYMFLTMLFAIGCSQLYDPPPTDPEPEQETSLPSETDDGYEDGSGDGGDDTGGDNGDDGASDCPEEPQSCAEATQALGLLPGLPVAGLLGNLLSGLPLLDILAPSSTEVCGHNAEQTVFETADQPGLIDQLTGGLLADGWSPLGEAQLDVCALLQLFTKNGDVLRLIADADGLVRLAL